MKLTISSGGATVENAWGLVGNVIWSGDKQRGARTLTFDLATSEADPGLPAVACPVGAVVSYWDDDGTPLFQGGVATRTLSDRDAALAVTAHDRGMYLSGNDGTIKVRDETAESAVARLCGQYGISVGELAATGVPLRRKFTGTPLWNIVTTLYTLAGRQTGAQYLARFEWDRLTVRIRREQAENLVIRPKSNLITSTTTESIEDMRNSVGIYDKDGNRLSTVQDTPRPLPSTGSWKPTSPRGRTRMPGARRNRSSRTGASARQFPWSAWGTPALPRAGRWRCSSP